MLFNVTRKTHYLELAPYLPTYFWDYLDRAATDPDFRQLTGHEGSHHVTRTYSDSSDEELEDNSSMESMNLL